ncbi:MAG: hypothetical protein RL481_2061, partial [Pseudomonadota bacterium]
CQLSVNLGPDPGYRVFDRLGGQTAL